MKLWCRIMNLPAICWPVDFNNFSSSLDPDSLISAAISKALCGTWCALLAVSCNSELQACCIIHLPKVRRSEWANLEAGGPRLRDLGYRLRCELSFRLTIYSTTPHCREDLYIYIDTYNVVTWNIHYQCLELREYLLELLNPEPVLKWSDSDRLWWKRS